MRQAAFLAFYLVNGWFLLPDYRPALAIMQQTSQTRLE